MAKYYQSLFGKFQKLDGKKHKSELWQRITTDFNAMGPIKTLEQWQRCWRDLKKAARLKMSNIRKYTRTSGGGVPCPLSLTDQESIIITICNLDSIDGVEGQEMGLNQTPTHTSFPSVRSSPAVSSSNDNSFHGFVPFKNESRSRVRPTTSHDTDSQRSARVNSLSGTSTRSTLYESPQNSDLRVRANSRESISSRRSSDRQSTTTSGKKSISLSGFHGQPWSRWVADFTSIKRTELTDQQVAKVPSTIGLSISSTTRPPLPDHNDLDLHRSGGSRSSNRNSHVSSERSSVQQTSRQINCHHRSRSVLSSVSGVSRNSISTSRNSDVGAHRTSSRNSHSNARHSSTTRSQEHTSTTIDSDFSFRRPTHTVQRRHQSVSSRNSASLSNQNNTSSFRRASISSNQRSRDCRSNSVFSSASRTNNSGSSISNMSRRSTYSRGSFQSDTEFSNRSQSRRNLTVTLARSVQSASRFRSGWTRGHCFRFTRMFGGTSTK